MQLVGCKSVLNSPVVYFSDYSKAVVPVMFLLFVALFNYWFSFTLAYSRISHKYSSLFIIVINLIFMFSL